MLTQVVLCGAISTMNSPQDFAGLSNYLSLLVNRARMEGFILLDFESEYQGTYRATPSPETDASVLNKCQGPCDDGLCLTMLCSLRFRCMSSFCATFHVACRVPHSTLLLRPSVIPATVLATFRSGCLGTEYCSIPLENPLRRFKIFFALLSGARSDLARWVLEGKIVHREHVIHGLENAPDAMLHLFSGGSANSKESTPAGKLLVQVCESAEVAQHEADHNRAVHAVGNADRLETRRRGRL